jgi:peptide/nickel transport system ATP-binding protein
MSESLLEIRDLGLRLPVDTVLRPVLRGVDLSVGAGECVGLVGESGSGKSMTARSVIRMLPSGAQLTGAIRFGGTSVLELSSRELRSLRAHRIAMIFQEPRAHIDPVRTVGDHMTEALRLLGGRGRRHARVQAEALLDAVKLENPRRLMGRHPHELSGGMLQRVMIAGALAGNPDLLLADEPTTALDVTTQAEVIAILTDLQAERGLGVLLISHDIELVSAVCDRIAVIYAGEIVEDSPAGVLRDGPLHPYTVGLLASRPSLFEDPSPLAVIPGQPISAFEVGEGCPFASRCRFTDQMCKRLAPEPQRLGSRIVSCHHSERIGNHLGAGEVLS